MNKQEFKRQRKHILDKRVCIYETKTRDSLVSGEGDFQKRRAVVVPGREEAEASLGTAKTELRPVPQPSSGAY